MNKNTLNQIKLAFDDTIGSIYNLIQDDLIDELKDYSRTQIINDIYTNVITCTYTNGGNVFINSNISKANKFASKDAIINEIKRLWSIDPDAKELDTYIQD